MGGSYLGWSGKNFSVSALNLNVILADKILGGLMSRLGHRLLLAAMYIASCVAVADIGDIDAEIEDTMAERDATTEGAKFARDRAAREKRDNQVARSQAELARVRANAKREEAQKELARFEREYLDLNAQKKKHLADKAFSDRVIAKEEQKMNAAQARRDKLKGELDAVVQIRSEQKKRLAEMSQQKYKLEMETARMKQTMEETKGEYKRGQLEQREQQAKIKRAEQAHLVEQQRAQAEVAKLKAAYQSTKDQTDAMKEDLRKKAEQAARAREQVQYGRSQLREQAAERDQMQMQLKRRVPAAAQ